MSGPAARAFPGIKAAKAAAVAAKVATISMSISALSFEVRKKC